MPIAKNPKRNRPDTEEQAQAFISRVGTAVATEPEEKQDEELRSQIEKIRESGVTTPKEIAAELNKRGIEAPPSARSNGQWSALQVQRVQGKKDGDPYKEPVMIRVDPKMLDRIDHAAKRLGISRSAFILSSTATRLESME
jgi:hypothetical protein